MTLIEVIMVMLIIAVLASAGSCLLVYMVRNGVFIPNQLHADMLASDALDIMIEGDAQVKGLRFNKGLTNILNYRMTFINQDGQRIRYRLDTAAKRIYRSIDGGGDVVFPYYAGQGSLNLTGQGNTLFSYYDQNGNSTTTPSQVRKISISLIARTGNGSQNEWQGERGLSSAIAVNPMP